MVRTGVKVCDLPLETRLCITLCKRAAYKSPQPVACVTMELFDYRWVAWRMLQQTKIEIDEERVEHDSSDTLFSSQ